MNSLGDWHFLLSKSYYDYLQLSTYCRSRMFFNNSFYINLTPLITDKVMVLYDI